MSGNNDSKVNLIDDGVKEFKQKIIKLGGPWPNAKKALHENETDQTLRELEKHFKDNQMSLTTAWGDDQIRMFFDQLFESWELSYDFGQLKTLRTSSDMSRNNSDGLNSLHTCIKELFKGVFNQVAGK